MENKDLNDNILKNVRNKIVVSNLESEENMRLNMKKQLFSICATIIVVMAGSFVTVNAATDGKLLDDIKESIKVNFVKENGNKEELKGNTYTDSKGDTWVKYEKGTGDDKSMLEIDKTLLDKENLEIDAEIKEDTNKEEKIEMTIKNK